MAVQISQQKVSKVKLWYQRDSPKPEPFWESAVCNGVKSALYNGRALLNVDAPMTADQWALAGLIRAQSSVTIPWPKRTVRNRDREAQGEDEEDNCGGQKE